MSTKFSKLEVEEPDPIVKVMGMSMRDSHPSKVDVTIGIYKDEQGGLYQFPVVTKAKQILSSKDPGHNYTTMQGIPEFTRGARKVVFGDHVDDKNIVTMQSISGTGSIHLAAALLKEAGLLNFYIGVPAWSNYEPMIEWVGGKVNTYTHYDEQKQALDFDSVVNALNSAPADSVFLFQTSCHNPTGADFSKDQWKIIGDLCKKNSLLAILDTAYQGFATGSKDEDAWPIRLFYDLKIDFLVCQSFSKNLGLYGERTGALHVVVSDAAYVPHVTSTLVSIFRKECSFAPAWGARIAAEVFKSPELCKEWDEQVRGVTQRLKDIRLKVYNKFLELKTPGNWEPVIKQNGLFWWSGMTEAQSDLLAAEHHVYSTGSGRVNISGLNNSNFEHFCKAVDTVVRQTTK